MMEISNFLREFVSSSTYCVTKDNDSFYLWLWRIFRDVHRPWFI